MKEFLAFSYCPVRGMRAWLALMLTLLLGLDRLLHRTAGRHHGGGQHPST
jgi:hypothetical protein